MFFWLDCIVSSISTIWFAVKWYTSMDQQLDDTTDNEEAKKMLADSLKMEKMLSIGMLVLLRLVHFYFAYVVTLYYKSIHMAQYARVPSSMEQGEEETELDTRNPTYPSSGSNKVPKPSID
ncbi:uncharacterized protein BYT42DRAFT_503089 [Radiomyces spectabilis]|uniref:uncharacterized protein n=1 Tax=Radiomyces spectabilis TaxID=64574 RepID=UPI00221EB4B1|nr:uncharacterized protein BYT42DRAFT_503089 [Radiomyces spectabilis]KAI8369608.1 hypothetical protein BYT42DRAFT_503089 [Radiomyces spectabilis]